MIGSTWGLRVSCFRSHTSSWEFGIFFGPSKLRLSGDDRLGNADGGSTVAEVWVYSVVIRRKWRKDLYSSP